MNHAPLLFALQPGLPLGLLATAAVVTASFVSLSIYRHSAENEAWRRTSWMLLAGVTGAFGIWAAHLVVTLGQGRIGAAQIDAQAAVAALLLTAALMSSGFIIAARGPVWHPAAGGAVNGTSIGLMHYGAIYALAVPGVVEWNLPLVAASVGLGAGFGSAAFTANRKLDGAAALWCGVGLLTLAFCGVHFLGIHAAPLASDGGGALDPHTWVLATVVAGMAMVVLALGLSAMFIDRQTRDDNAHLLQKLVDAAIEGIVVVGDARILNINRRMAELCRVEEAKLAGMTAANLFDRPIEADSEVDAFLNPAFGESIPVRVLRRELGRGQSIYAVHDLSELRAAEEQSHLQNALLQKREEDLRDRNLLLDTALSHLQQGLCMYDRDQRIVVCNARYATLYGLTADDVKPGTRRSQVAEQRVAVGLWSGASPAEYVRRRSLPVSAADYAIEKLSDGRSIAVSTVPMPGGGCVTTHEDITEQRQAQARIEHLARHDALTNLPNRRTLREALAQTLAQLRPGEGLAVHCLDIDRFKEVNDALGHAVGDEVLQAVARRLRRVLGPSDTLARIGGDEFVIVQNHASSPTAAIELASEIMAQMSEPFSLGDRLQVVLTTSAGIALAPADGTQADQLLRDADLALSRTKQEARGRYCFFEQEMDARMRARHDLERRLRGALANGELGLDFQPLLNVKRNKISCFEALLRWRPPGEAAIPPGEFVPIAEETGLIVPIGEWVLRRALTEAAKWPRHIRVAVNMSPVQFNMRNLAQVVTNALAASGVEPNRLELEITESLLLQNSNATLATLHQLRDIGVRIALDDFGTGFSSLSYLRSFPFDKIKIDRCFIEGLGEGNEELLAIVRAVSRLGASLGIATAAEGVETQAQADIVRREGFTEIQGYWLAEPKPASAIVRDFEPQPKPRKREQSKAQAGGGNVDLPVARAQRQRRTKSARSD